MPADAVPLPAPGSLTVPLLTGWEGLVLMLLAVVAVALGFLVIGALATGRRSRSPEWQAWLEGRSRSRLEPGEPTAADAPARDAADATHGVLGAHLRR